MPTASLTPVRTAIDALREQARAIHRVLRLNTEGLTHQDSLIQPQPAGNCLNWNVGHLVGTNEIILSLLGQAPVLGEQKLERYKRGTAPLRDDAEAVPLGTLLTAWDESCERIDKGFAAFPEEKLAEPAPFSPRSNPSETYGSLLSILMFHQASHTGQTSLLRRICGKEGAIK